MTNTKHPLGVIHGRFQVFHNDHLTYVLAGAERCEHLYVGITNPDPRSTRPDPADPQRSLAVNNPLTYYERQRMVNEALGGAGLDWRRFTIVPLPIGHPELFQYYVPLDAIFFLTIYDGWGERKLALFEELGLATEVMWRRPIAEKGITGSQVRELIASGGDWESLVPPSVVKIIREIDLAERLGA